MRNRLISRITYRSRLGRWNEYKKKIRTILQYLKSIVQHLQNMWSALGIIFITLELVIGSDYYWRDYNGTIPSDAFLDNETDLAVARIYSKKYPGFHPTGLNNSSGPEVKYEAEKITDIIQVLCVGNPEKYNWEWINAATVRSTKQSGLVQGGYDKYGSVYIARIFYKDHWYLGEVDGESCFFYGVSDCYHKITSGKWCQTPDCMILKYQ